MGDGQGGMAIGSGTFFPRFITEDFKSAIRLLDSKARISYFVFSFLQIFVAILEVIALSILTVTITLGLNGYTNISNQREVNLGPLSVLLVDSTLETQVATLLCLYILTTITKTLCSAKIISSTLNLLAKQAAIVGFELNRNTFDHKAKLIRFGKSQENLGGITGSLNSLLIGYLGTFNQLIGDIATITMVAVALLFFDFETSMVLFFLFGVLLIILHFSINVIATELGKSVTILSSHLNRKILDSWLVYRELLLAQRVDELLKPTLVERLELATSRARLSFLPSLSKYIFEIFLIVIALMTSSIQLWRNGLSEAVSGFILIAAASARLLPALLRLQGNLLLLRQSAGGAIFVKRLLKRLSEETDSTKLSLSTEVYESSFSATVSIIDVSFVYPESTKHAVSNFSLSITPGTLTAITGASGSGKSTLIDLILGFLEPTSGSVLLSGIDPLSARQVWPGKIAYVPQDVQVFEGTILENITLTTSGEFNEKSLYDCIKSSGLLEDMVSLSQGVHTRVGERGLKLSGGQKQRLGIARALYSNPKLLILDEATSSLDPITEDIVTKSVFQRMPDRAVIVVAHRLSTVMHADTVLYLKNGSLKASGRFEDLKRLEPEFLKQAELSGL